LAGLAIFWIFYPQMSNGEVIRFELAWLPAFGLGFTLRLDGFAWMFGVLVTGIGFLVVLYARYYMSPADPGARMSLVVTSAGGLCLFAGALLLGHIVGSYDLDGLLGAGDRIRTNALYLPALILVLLGALTKSAQFPFHFWLPHAMAAPTPVWPICTRPRWSSWACS